MGTAEIMTDAGRAYIKAMGNPCGPHQLACEWLGTKLAKWFGLRVFDAAIIMLTEQDEIPFAQGGQASPGPAFVTRAEEGDTWSGTSTQLKRLNNHYDLTRLIVFDTWLRNCDRYSKDGIRIRRNVDNVFISRENCPNKDFALVAMDHSHCFTCGNDLSPRIAHIGAVREERLYGAFPEFGPHFDLATLADCLSRLARVTGEAMSEMLDSIPREWEVDVKTREALKQFLLGRAAYLKEKPAEFFRP